MKVIVYTYIRNLSSTLSTYNGKHIRTLLRSSNRKHKEASTFYTMIIVENIGRIKHSQIWHIVGIRITKVLFLKYTEFLICICYH